MTSSGECHTFGVPELISILNTQAQVVWRPHGPLVHWQVIGADDLWVPIDHTSKLFEQFLNEGPQPLDVVNTVQDSGHLVVVSGGGQVGKTSFLHKAIHNLAQRLNEVIPPADGAGPHGGRQEPAPDRWAPMGPEELGQVRVVAVAGPRNSPGKFGGSGGGPLDVNRVHTMILREVCDALRIDVRTLDEPSVTDESEYWRAAYQRLSRRLVRDRHPLLILLPDFGWGDEALTRRFYRSCRDYARSCIVFFVESGNAADCRQDLELEFGDDLRRHQVTYLEIGPMGDGDWQLFIDNRHGASIPGPRVRVGAEVRAAAPDLLTRSTVGRLREVLHAATQLAHQNAQDEVTSATLREAGRRFGPPRTEQYQRDDAGSSQQTEDT